MKVGWSSGVKLRCKVGRLRSVGRKVGGKKSRFYLAGNSIAGCH